MTESVEIRAHIVDVFRRDLIGPGEQDTDLANERLNESPSRWYLTGDLALQDEKGLFHCLGRVDNQVKINGFRVELRLPVVQA